MTDNFINGLLYGPSGPDNKRVGDDTWGKLMEEAMAGNDDEGFIEKTQILGKYTFGIATYFAMTDVILINNKVSIRKINKKRNKLYVASFFKIEK